MCLGLGFAALPALKVVNPPLITYSDVFIVLGLTMLVPRGSGGGSAPRPDTSSAR